MEVKVNFLSVSKIKIGTDVKVDPETGAKTVVGSISFQVEDVNGSDIARIINLQRQAQPVDVIFKCQQAVLPFREVVDEATGEIKPMI